MFDLKSQTRQWRRTLVRALDGPPEILDELESHLIEHFEKLVREGRTEEQAWESAVVKLGSAEQLAAEYDQPVTASWRPVRYAQGASLVGLVALVLLIIAKFHIDAASALLSAHVFTITVGYTALLFAGTLAACYAVGRLVRPLNWGQFQSLKRGFRQFTFVAAIMTAVGVVLGAIWARTHWGRYWVWDPKEIGGAVILAWSFLIYVAQRRRWVLGHQTMVACLIGNIVTAAGWFGASYVSAKQLHNYGLPPSFVTLLWIFAGAQVALMALSALPAGCLRRQNA